MKVSCSMMFDLLLDVRECFLNLPKIPTLPARIGPYPAGRLFWGGAVPGTSCQATIAPSLRDKNILRAEALTYRLKHSYWRFYICN